MGAASSVGTLGTRFHLSQEGNTIGYIEVCQLSAELSRSNASRGWADVGNLEVEDGVDSDTVVPHLYSVGAGWLLQAESRLSSTTTPTRNRRIISSYSSGVVSRRL